MAISTASFRARSARMSSASIRSSSRVRRDHARGSFDRDARRRVRSSVPARVRALVRSPSGKSRGAGASRDRSRGDPRPPRRNETLGGPRRVRVFRAGSGSPRAVRGNGRGSRHDRLVRLPDDRRMASRNAGEARGHESQGAASEPSGSHEVPRQSRAPRARRLWLADVLAGRGRGRARRAISRRGEAHDRIPERNRSASSTRTPLTSSSFSISPRTRGRPACSRISRTFRARTLGALTVTPIFRGDRKDDRHFHLDVSLHEHDGQGARQGHRGDHEPPSRRRCTSAPRPAPFIPRPRTRCSERRKRRSPTSGGSGRR